SAASQEQAAGIDQVNKAVMQMDQGTQQNAALVEQATSASQSMAQQAQDLLRQVEFFKVQAEVGRITGAEARMKAPSFVQTQSPRPMSSQPSHSISSVSRSGSEKHASTQKKEAVGVGSSTANGHKKVEDDFFEEF
ncbi:MAG: hypothetical protein AB7P17_05330, partial [Nitrospirales bacterium]